MQNNERDGQLAAGVLVLFSASTGGIIGIAVLAGVLAYMVGLGAQSVLALPGWALAIVFATLIASTIACVRGKLKTVYQPYIAAAFMIFISGIVQSHQSLFAFSAPATSDPSAPLSNVAIGASQIVGMLGIAVPWLAAIVVIGLSAANLYIHAIQLKERQGG